MFVLFFGRVMGMPEWIGKITPFGHIPLLIVQDVNYAVLAVLTAIAAALAALGFVCYKRRDMLTV
jgi:ABC-2 type transport system permease protein